MAQPGSGASARRTPHHPCTALSCATSDGERAGRGGVPSSAKGVTMTQLIRALVPMLALVACAVEPSDPGSTQGEEVQALGDPNICATGPWTICNGLSFGEFCGSPLRCFPWNE